MDRIYDFVFAGFVSRCQLSTDWHVSEMMSCSSFSCINDGSTGLTPNVSMRYVWLLHTIHSCSRDQTAPTVRPSHGRERVSRRREEGEFAREERQVTPGSLLVTRGFISCASWMYFVVTNGITYWISLDPLSSLVVQPLNFSLEPVNFNTQ